MLTFLGFPYPIEKTHKGYFYSQNGIEQIKADMLILLLTNPGERCMNPEYGTPLKKLMFEPNDSVLQQAAKAVIAKSLARWEPRVAVSQIDVLKSIDIDSLNVDDNLSEAAHILQIRILFIDPQNIKQVEELLLKMPISGQA